MNYHKKVRSEQLQNALKRLNEIVELPPGKHRAEIDATIQRFEFCIELFWKALQEKLFNDYGIAVQSPKKAFEQAYINHLINDEPLWINMINDRNLTVHTYNQDLADQMYNRIKQYAPFLTNQYRSCFKKNL